MAYRKSGNTSRGSKRPFSSKGGAQSGSSGFDKSRSGERGQRSGDKKSFFSKFKRKEDSSFGTKKFDNRDKRQPGPSRDKKFDKPLSKRSSERPAGKSSYKEKRSFSADKKYGKSFQKRSSEGFSDRPGYGANRAFSAGKKHFRKSDDKRGGEQKEGGYAKPSSQPFFKKEGKFRKTAEGTGYPQPRKFPPRGKRDVMKELEVEKKSDGLIRLNKFISNSGVCSRREADELIKMGLISVNGTVITEMGYKVKPTDDVRHESKKLYAEKPVYVLLNKPKGYITTTDDPQERKTVMSLIGNAVKERIYPVGRLDRNTTGLLLLTNDGDLADKLTHPSYKARKLYKVELDKPLTKTDFDKIVEGVRLEEGKAMVDDLAYVEEDKRTIGIELHIGWNRIVRRIFEFLGYEVVKLDRVIYAGLDKKDLGRGEWRYLKDQEVVKLKHLKS